MSEERDKHEITREPNGYFKKGFSGNPNGRPVGQSLKEYTRQKLASMSEDEKEAFISGIEEYKIWTMSEGNPAQHTDITTQGEKITYTPEVKKVVDEFEEKLNKLEDEA